jgi:hypothetical protein
VVNLGLDGTGTDVHLQLLREYLPKLRPDVVVLAFYANDVADLQHGRFQRECHEGYVLSYQTLAQRDRLRARVDAHRAKTLRVWLFEHSYQARLLGALLLPRGSPYRLHFQQARLAELGPAALDPAAGVRRHRLALQGLEQLASSCDCRLLVAPVPPRRDPEASREIWSRRAAGTSLELLDVLPALARARRELGAAHEDLYFVHDNHLNVLGNELYGRAVAEALLE